MLTQVLLLLGLLAAAVLVVGWTGVLTVIFSILLFIGVVL